MENWKTTSELSLREKIRLIWKVAEFSPGLFILVIIFNVASAVLEGVGLSFILPIIELIEAGDKPIQAGDSLVSGFILSYDYIGIPFTLGTVVLGVLLIMTVRFATTFFGAWLRSILSNRYVQHLQQQAYAESVGTTVKFFDDQGTDKILNAIVTQAVEVRRFVNSLMQIIFLSLLTIVYMSIAFYISPFLIIFSGALLGGVMIVFNYLVDSGEKLGDELADANEEIQESVQSSLQGIRDVKVLGLKNYLTEKVRKSTEKYALSRIEISKNKEMIKNFYNLATISAIFSLIYFALVFTDISLSALGLFLVALFRFSPKLSNINSHFYNVMGYLPNHVRTHQFLESLRKSKSDNGIKLNENIERISFNNIDFSYREELILKGIDLNFRQDSIHAFVGPSGAGKSTIASLMAGFYKPDDGSIVINDSTPLSTISRDSWWAKISFVRQEPFIFNTTIRQNLQFADPGVSDEEIMKVAEDTLITEYFDELNNGLDTILGERGVRLSGGQRQRLALARTLLKPADVLILDEATSALDYHLENKVYENLAPYFEGKIVVLIAHRLATVRQADQIHFLEGGRIQESGTHEELYEKEGHYFDLHQQQDKQVSLV